MTPRIAGNESYQGIGGCIHNRNGATQGIPCDGKFAIRTDGNLDRESADQAIHAFYRRVNRASVYRVIALQQANLFDLLPRLVQCAVPRPRLRAIHHGDRVAQIVCYVVLTRIRHHAARNGHRSRLMLREDLARRQTSELIQRRVS